MSVWTSEELTAQLTAWKQALLAVSGGKGYTVAGRTLTLQDAAEIRATIQWLEAELRKLDGTHGPVFVSGRVAR
ncbi:DUF6148 family protein [Desulfocurvus sp. DL9XJH121]